MQNGKKHDTIFQKHKNIPKYNTDNNKKSSKKVCTKIYNVHHPYRSYKNFYIVIKVASGRADVQYIVYVHVKVLGIG